MDIPDAELADPSLFALQTSLADLKSLMKSLEDTRHFCDSFVQNVGSLLLAMYPIFRIGKTYEMLND